MGMQWIGVTEFKAALDRTVAGASAGARAAVTEAAHTVQRKAMDNASGAPGPDVVTGSLRRGIQVTAVRPWGVGGWQTTVGPTMIYSRRIDLGYHGTDAVGRVYTQAPKPYFTPAWSSTDLREIYVRNWRKGVGV